MAVEEAPYEVETRDGHFEIRQYAPQVVAETVVEGTQGEAGNKAFGALFGYISGANRSRQTIAMTAPVGQERVDGERIAMTAPVAQQAVSNRWAVTFMMPTNYVLATLPEPTGDKVRLRAVPARRMAAIRYSGSWGQARYEKHLARLRTWLAGRGVTPVGEPVWARYNPPFTPWFLRRNEILLELGDKP